MPVITIREQQQTATGFAASLSFGDGEYDIIITDPFTHQEEEDLEWYFEEWLVFPMTGTVKAERAKNSVKTYGEKLFEQVFQDKKAYSKYQQVKNNLSQVQIEIVSKTPEFQALHWEALQDPDFPRPLAVDCVMLRKSVNSAVGSVNLPLSPVINLLVVVARPDEEKDAGYRTISRPLVELIENGKLRVKVKLLRPGTFQALSQHLEAQGANFYHIIHLDMHGALLTHKQVEKPSAVNRYLFKGRYGRDDLQPFEGVKAFLAFEGENPGKVDLVEASELAALLTGKGIPVCILNACQSGKQVKTLVGQASSLSLVQEVGQDAQPTIEGATIDKNAKNTIGEEVRETSLGSRLMSAGMQMVVAMGYSVTVTAAKLMMEHLYKHLFADKPITEAIRLSRRELFNDKERKAYFNKLIKLEDWLLPVVYYNQSVNFNLRQFTPEEEEKYFETVGSEYRFPLPTYGFVGRDLEILKIEKALLKHNVLLLKGMGGTGKTTLLKYLQEWWQKTNFDYLANCYLQTKDYQKAQELYQKKLTILSEVENTELRRKKISTARTYHQLGYVAQEMREYAQARDFFQQALSIFIEFSDRYSQARTYHNLGRVAQEMREYTQARDFYQQALSIKIEFGNRYSQSATYHDLGIVAQKMREYAQARNYYQQALSIKIEFGDRYEQASTYHNLGIVAQKMREYAQARNYYQQALSIKIEFGDRYSQASTYHGLGALAEAQEDYTKARTNLQKALEIYVEYKDEYWGNIARENLERLPE
jgi:tetratricopeptide (TPR) repeat protein